MSLKDDLSTSLKKRNVNIPSNMIRVQYPLSIDQSYIIEDGIEIVGDGICTISINLETSTGDIFRTIIVNSKGECDDSTEIGIKGKKLRNGYLLEDLILKIKGKNIVCTNCKYINRVYKDEIKKNSVIFCQICKKKGTYIPRKDVSKDLIHYLFEDNINGILI